MKKRKVIRVTSDEKLAMEIKRSYEERMLDLLRLIRVSNLVSEAGEKYRKH